MIVDFLLWANKNINVTLVSVVAIGITLLGFQFRAAFKMFAIRRRKLSNLLPLGLYTFAIMVPVLLCHFIADLARVLLNEQTSWAWNFISTFLSSAVVVYFIVLLIFGILYAVQTFVYNFRR